MLTRDSFIKHFNKICKVMKRTDPLFEVLNDHATEAICDAIALSVELLEETMEVPYIAEGDITTWISWYLYDCEEARSNKEEIRVPCGNTEYCIRDAGDLYDLIASNYGVRVDA